MTLFIDASALTAIIRKEDDARAVEAELGADPVRVTSGVAVWETARAVAGDTELQDALEEVERYCTAFDIVVVPIGATEAAEAVRAHARYGKGTGHPARLNMGDCFAYACARTHRARLLYKGDDFSHTDMAL